MKLTKFFAFIVPSLIAVSALAQTNIEDQKAVIDVQIELLRKQADLNNALRAVAGSNNQSMPSVVSISKVGDRRIARLQIANGVTEYYSEGDMVRAGMEVKAITPKQVIVYINNGKKRTPMVLDFVAQANANPQPFPNQNQSVPLELLPPLPDVTVPTFRTKDIPAPAAKEQPQVAPAALATATKKAN